MASETAHRASPSTAYLSSRPFLRSCPDTTLKSQDSKLKQQEAFVEALKGLRLQEVTGLLADHHFRSSVTNFGPSACTRSKASLLCRGVKDLAENLPLEWDSGIFLCQEETRMDVLRAMIVGPQGTPYWNGLFMFDIFLPAGYPNQPPQVQFLTTGGGRIRFNPNLYACGKVCLSLINTWSGPSWEPSRSTLLQVLVSLQALVLVADPYFNEPGYVGNGNRAAADSYIQEQRYNTLKYAILPAIQQRPRHFTQVVGSFLQLKRQEILQQCDDWLTGADYYWKGRLQSTISELKAGITSL